MKIILDTDIGDDIDDAFALLLALKTEKLELMGVTTVFRNTLLRAKIAAYIIREAGENVKVYAGESHPLKQEIPRFDYEKTDTEGYPVIRQYFDYMRDEKVESMSAADFIVECAEKYPDEVSVLTIGPLTNLALAFRKSPEKFKKLKHLYVMGGELAAKHNEWNIRFDAFASAEVFAAGLPITLVPLEATRPCVVYANDFDEIKKIGTPGLKAIEPMLAEWKQNFGKNLKCTMHDPLAVSLLTEDFCRTEKRKIKITTAAERLGYTDFSSDGVEVECKVDTNDRAFMKYFIKKLKEE